MRDSAPFDSPDGFESGHMSQDDRATVVDALVGEMGELFHGYVRGEVPFEELTFELFDTLQTLYAVTHGAMTIEYDDDADDLDALDGPSLSHSENPNGKSENGRGKGKRNGERGDRD